MEKRIESIENVSADALPHTRLPAEYLKVVADLVEKHFKETLVQLRTDRPTLKVKAEGRMYQDEITLAVSLVQTKTLASPTVNASADFDPQASSPTAQDLLNHLLDAIGQTWETLLDLKKPARIEQLFSGSLSAMENVPFTWSAIEIGKRRVFVLLDTTNPDIDRLTEEWLKENDPDFRKEVQRADEEVLEKINRGISGADSQLGEAKAAKDKGKLH